MISPDLPGADLVVAGLADLAAGRRETVEALLVTVGAPRLRTLGIDVPPGEPAPERRLYEALEPEFGDAAHSRYNALIQRLVSFERALACVA